MTKMLPMLDPFDEIKRLYFTTTPQTIERDITRALDLLTHMATDEARERAAGYMHGLADLRREWKPKTGRTGQPGPPGKRGPGQPGRSGEAGRGKSAARKKP